jgi:hypothetical protein
VISGPAGTDTIATFPDRVTGLSNRTGFNSCRAAAVGTDRTFGIGRRWGVIDPERSLAVSDNRHSPTYKQTLNAVIRR